MKGGETFHTPVLVNEVIEALRVEEGKKYIDATLGGGGHSFEILRRGGVVLGIDCDQEAIDYVRAKFQIEKDLTLVRGNFKNIGEIARLHEFKRVAGILFDLGASSYQFETAERGFSFQRDALLDMRMDRTLAVKAADLVNGLTKGELYELFTKLGQEKLALAISDRIVRARKIRPIETTRQLADLVIEAYGGRGKVTGINPATRVFQALRIAVNDELNSLKHALPEAFELLEKNGRLIVISFHSLEDAIVKRFFRDREQGGRGNVLTKKPMRPKSIEIVVNPRARSARMRVIEKDVI